MATAGSPESSPTPQWDSRNRGFIPPSQLQRLRQSSPLAREFVSSDRPLVLSTAAGSVTPRISPTLRPSPSMAIAHSRTTAFFGFLRPNENPPSTMPSRTAEPGLQQQVSSDEQDRLTPGSPHPPRPASAALERSPSLPTTGMTQTTQLHPEIRSVVNLTHAHAHKIYMSGPLVRRIERLPDGHHPIKDEGWRDVWAQLGGTTLSVWDMKEIDEASKQGKEVPPTYINVTDAVSHVFYHTPVYQLIVTLVCASSRRRHDSRVGGCPCPKVQQCRHSQHRRVQPHPPFLSQRS
jgi:CCR4-NOT transcriptional complex subunit CAF120